MRKYMTAALTVVQHTGSPGVGVNGESYNATDLIGALAIALLDANQNYETLGQELTLLREGSEVAALQRALDERNNDVVELTRQREQLKNELAASRNEYAAQKARAEKAESQLPAALATELGKAPDGAVVGADFDKKGQQ